MGQNHRTPVHITLENTQSHKEHITHGIYDIWRILHMEHNTHGNTLTIIHMEHITHRTLHIEHCT